MVGTNTARTDNPRLNVRLVPGRNPIRVVIDKQLRLAESLNLFDGSQPTLGYNFIKTETVGQTSYIQLSPDKPFLPQLLADLYQRKIQSVLVEGGTTLLNSFMEAGLWDEMRVFRSQTMLNQGRSDGPVPHRRTGRSDTPADAVRGPEVRGTLISREMSGEDELTTYKNDPTN